jgi:Zn-dependent protease
VLEFSYHRSISPTLGVLLGLAIVETMVIHVVAVALWGWTVASVLGILDLSLVAALVGLLRSIRRYPVTIADGMLTMRIGALKQVQIPLGQVVGLRRSWNAEALRQKGVTNFALGSWPNVVVDLARPVRVRRRQVSAIAHKLDDPAAFARAIESITRSAASPDVPSP